MKFKVFFFVCRKVAWPRATQISSDGDPFCGEGIHPRWAAKQPPNASPMTRKNLRQERTGA
ncbi:hypothetical protein OC610_18370, partial [Pseudomonas sp. SAICEU22]